MLCSKLWCLPLQRHTKGVLAGLFNFLGCAGPFHSYTLQHHSVNTPLIHSPIYWLNRAIYFASIASGAVYSSEVRHIDLGASRRSFRASVMSFGLPISEHRPASICCMARVMREVVARSWADMTFATVSSNVLVLSVRSYSSSFSSRSNSSLLSWGEVICLVRRFFG